MPLNPVKRVFKQEELFGTSVPMTLSGTLTKISILFGSLGVGAAVGCYLLIAQSALVFPAVALGMGVAFIIGMVSVFRPHTAQYTAVPYAFCQGFSLGVMTLFFEARYPGIAAIGLLLTAATALAMLLLYRFQIIKVTETVRSIIVSATAAVGLTYGIVLILWLCGFNTASFFESTSLTSIMFSLFVIGLAAFNLLLDFALIEEGVERGLPKYMEWYAAFSLLVTLIWLYIEMVRLLVKYSRRRN